MKKFGNVCLLLVVSAVFAAAPIQLWSKAQNQSAVQGQPSTAQGHDATHAEVAEKTKDPLGRSTPHGTVYGFLLLWTTLSWAASEHSRISKKAPFNPGSRQITRRLEYFVSMATRLPSNS